MKKAKGDYIALVDSDNLLPTKDWLNQMIDPLIKHKDVIGSEPWEYTWRKFPLIHSLRIPNGPKDNQ